MSPTPPGLLAVARPWRAGATLSQTDERARVKARIKALAERTVSRGCTEAEAMAAADMVGRLLERYALTMDEVDVRAEPCVRTEIPLGGRRRRPIDGCVPAIGRFCDCKVWLAREAQQASYVFFGFEADVSLARYLFTVIDRAITTSLAEFRRDHPALAGTMLRRASDSFQHGMAHRVAERLGAMHAEREAAMAAARSNGTALILAKTQVVAQAFAATSVRLVSTRGLAARRNAAYRHGQAAGERVNLNRPVEGHDRRRLG